MNLRLQTSYALTNLTLSQVNYESEDVFKRKTYFYKICPFTYLTGISIHLDADSDLFLSKCVF